MPKAMAAMEWLIHETGLYTLYCSGTRDIYIILLNRFLRMFAYGGVALVLGMFLWSIGEKDHIGLFLSLTLVGDAIISYILTLVADRVGRRRVLMVGSLLMTLSGTTFVFVRNYWVLLIAATVGVLSPGAHEVGPFLAIEESVVAHLTSLDARTDIYVWFAVSSTIGMAVGLVVTGWTTYLLHERGYEWSQTYPFIFGMYAVMGLVKASFTLLLSPACEADSVPVIEDTSANSGLYGSGERTGLLDGRSSDARRPSTTKKQQPTSTVRRIRKTISLPTRISPESRPILLKLCVLFGMNAFATGMLPTTLMAWYINWRYRWFLTHRVGFAMSAVWLVSSLSQLASASLARRFGLVPTMVITHMPAAIFLAFLPLAKVWYVFLILLLLVSAFGSTDQAPRAAFVAACFKRNERTTVMGTLNLVKTICRAGGPVLANVFWKDKRWGPPFIIAASVKIAYDLGLLAMFLRTTLPEERIGGAKGDGGRSMGEIRVNEVDVGILLGERVYEEEGSLLPRPEEFEDDEDDDGYGRGDDGDLGNGAEGSSLSSSEERGGRRDWGGRNKEGQGLKSGRGTVMYTV